MPRSWPVFLAPILALGLAATAGPAAGQEALAQQCGRVNAAFQAQCGLLAQTAAIAQPRFSLAAAGGNPVPGNASTVGMRLGSTPRISLDLRAGAARMSVPATSGGGSVALLASSLDADAAVGVYGGFSPAPTVGGVASIDLLGSIGLLPGPGNGFHGSPVSGAAGVRLGLFRESFTLPGISFSAMYRHTGPLRFGTGLPGLTLPHASDWSLRAVAGKRLFSLGTSAGLGWDRYASDATISWTCPPDALCPPGLPASVAAPLRQSRVSGFAALTWTSLVFNAVAELGWQRGGSAAGLPTPTGQEALVRKGGLFGNLALRLTI